MHFNSEDPPPPQSQSPGIAATVGSMWICLCCLLAGEGFSRMAVGGMVYGLAFVAGAILLTRTNGAKPWAYLILFLTTISLFRIYYIVACPLDLSGDEAFYWVYTTHPDINYYEKGPAIAWLIQHTAGK